MAEKPSGKPKLPENPQEADSTLPSLGVPTNVDSVLNRWDLDDLDSNDVLRSIAKSYTLEQFSALSLDEMLALFHASGTSSSQLFDIILKKSLQEFQSRPENQAFLLPIREELTRFAQTVKDKGFKSDDCVVKPHMFTTYRVANLDSLEEFRANYEDIFYKRLASILLLKLWSLFQNTKFIREFYRSFSFSERQFGYAGKRGSIVNNLFIFVASEVQDIERADQAKQILALVSMLKEVNFEVTGSELFWLYLADAKTFSATFNHHQ